MIYMDMLYVVFFGYHIDIVVIINYVAIISVSSCFHLYHPYFNECFQRQLEKVWSIDLTIPLESPRGFWQSQW